MLEWQVSVILSAVQRLSGRAFYLVSISVLKGVEQRQICIRCCLLNAHLRGLCCLSPPGALPAPTHIQRP